MKSPNVLLLGNYPENQNPFGILRHDQTPRPAYVALAAAPTASSASKPTSRRSVERGFIGKSYQTPYLERYPATRARSAAERM